MAHLINLRYVFFYALLTGVGALTFFMLMPFFITFAVAITFAVIIQPLYRVILRMVKGRESLSALITMLIVGIVIFAPLSLIGTQVAREATDLYTKISESDTTLPAFINSLEQTIESYVQPYAPAFALDLDNVFRQALIWITGYIGPIFSNTLQTIFHFFLGIIAFYYLIKDGEKFTRTIVSLSPLSDKHDKQIFDRLIIAINSIVKGSLLIALIQGITSGIGFTIFGVPSATLWGSMAAIGALVPGVGTAIVIAPSVIYLFVTGSTGAAIGLSIWGFVAVGTIDNFLGPILVGRGVKIHPLFVLFAVIGGIQFFGPLGFILGPLVLSLLYALLDIYKLITKA